MSKFSNTPWFIYFPALLVVSGLTACMHPPDATIEIPPSPPPRERIQSELFPPEPAPLQTTAVSEGITLLLEDKPVNLDDLEPASLPGEQTVLIRVHPSTTYEEVVFVMEHLHDLGFLIQFQSGN